MSVGDKFAFGSISAIGTRNGRERPEVEIRNLEVANQISPPFHVVFLIRPMNESRQNGGIPL
jgi:hypothetical protein